MANKATNEQILRAAMAENAALASALQGVDLTDGRAVAMAFEAYPTAKNQFVDAIIDKVAKTVFYSRVYNNPLKVLHKGRIPFGSSIEQIFVGMAEKVGFGSNFGADATESLIGKKLPVVSVDYITRNFQDKYKVSISEEQLTTAFLSASGLSEMVSQLLSSEVSAAERDEYVYMKGLLDGVVTGAPTTATVTAKAGDIRDLAVKIRATANKLSFISNKYNKAGVDTFSTKGELVLFVDCDTQAELDVNIIAQAFNVSSAEATVRTIVVDSLPAGVKAIVADERVIQFYETLPVTVKKFENGDQLYTNYFLHKQGIAASCQFVNCAVIKEA